MRFFAAIFGSALLVGAPASAFAQAYLGEANSLSGSFSYSFAPSGKIVATSTGDDDPADDFIPNVPVFAHLFQIGVQYNTPVDGLAIDAALPMIGVRLGDDSFTHFPAPGPYDDGDTHFTLTDFRGGLAYQVKAIEEYIGLSFGVAGSVPLRDYPTTGFAYPAQHLKALYLNAAIARTLDPVIPNLFFQGQYEFAKREKVDDDPETEKFSRDFSEVNVLLGYFLPADLYLAAAANMRFSHGGVSFAQLIFENQAVQDAHDRLLDEDFILVGGDIGYSVTEALSLSAGMRFFVWGENTRNQNLFGLNADYKFF